MNKWQQAIDVVYDSCIDNRGFVITLLSEAEQLQQERDQLAARCELLRKFGAGWAERAGADDQAWDYLSELSSGVYSLSHHDAELLRSVADEFEFENRNDKGGWSRTNLESIITRIRTKADQLEREQ